MPTFEENIAATVDAIGDKAALKAPGVVIGIGMTQWDSIEQRDEFLRFIGSPRR